MAIVSWQPWVAATYTYTALSGASSGTLEVDVPTGPFNGPYWNPRLKDYEIRLKDDDSILWNLTNGKWTSRQEKLAEKRPSVVEKEALPDFISSPAPLSEDEVDRLIADWRKTYGARKSAENRHARPSAVEKEALPDFPAERQRWLTGKCVLCGRQRRRWFKFLGAYCRLCHPAPAFVIGAEA